MEPSWTVWGVANDEALFMLFGRASGRSARGGPLRTYERNFAADSTTNRQRREYCAGNHEGKRKTNESKNKAVFGSIAIGVSCRRFVDVGLVG